MRAVNSLSNPSFPYLKRTGWVKVCVFQHCKSPALSSGLCFMRGKVDGTGFYRIPSVVLCCCFQGWTPDGAISTVLIGSCCIWVSLQLWTIQATVPKQPAHTYRRPLYEHDRRPGPVSRFSMWKRYGIDYHWSAARWWRVLHSHSGPGPLLGYLIPFWRVGKIKGTKTFYGSSFPVFPCVCLPSRMWLMLEYELRVATVFQNSWILCGLYSRVNVSNWNGIGVRLWCRVNLVCGSPLVVRMGLCVCVCV